MKVKNLLLMASVMFLPLTFSCQGNSGENFVLLDNGTVVQSEVGVARVGDVLLKDGKIVSIDDSISSDGCEVIDCAGKVVVAGFIDSHVHIESSMVLPPAFGEAVLLFGTTSVIADPHEVVNVAGGEGLDIFLKRGCGMLRLMCLLLCHQVFLQLLLIPMERASFLQRIWKGS